MKVYVMENKVLYAFYIILFITGLTVIIITNVPYVYAGHLIRLQYPQSSVHVDKIFSLHISNSKIKEWGFQSDAICGRYIVVDEVTNEKSEKSLWINFDQENVTQLSNDEIRQCLKFGEKNTSLLYEPILGIILLNRFFGLVHELTRN